MKSMDLLHQSSNRIKAIYAALEAELQESDPALHRYVEFFNSCCAACTVRSKCIHLEKNILSRMENVLTGTMIKYSHVGLSNSLPNHVNHEHDCDRQTLSEDAPGNGNSTESLLGRDDADSDFDISKSLLDLAYSREYLLACLQRSPKSESFFSLPMMKWEVDGAFKPNLPDMTVESTASASLKTIDSSHRADADSLNVEAASLSSDYQSALSLDEYSRDDLASQVDIGKIIREKQFNKDDVLGRLLALAMSRACDEDTLWRLIALMESYLTIITDDCGQFCDMASIIENHLKLVLMKFKVVKVYARLIVIRSMITFRTCVLPSKNIISNITPSFMTKETLGISPALYYVLVTKLEDMDFDLMTDVFKLYGSKELKVFAATSYLLLGGVRVKCANILGEKYTSPEVLRRFSTECLAFLKKTVSVTEYLLIVLATSMKFADFTERGTDRSTKEKAACALMRNLNAALRSEARQASSRSPLQSIKRIFAQKPNSTEKRIMPVVIRFVVSSRQLNKLLTRITMGLEEMCSLNETTASSLILFAHAAKLSGACALFVLNTFWTITIYDALCSPLLARKEEMKALEYLQRKCRESFPSQNHLSIILETLSNVRTSAKVCLVADKILVAANAASLCAHDKLTILSEFLLKGFANSTVRNEVSAIRSTMMSSECRSSRV